MSAKKKFIGFYITYKFYGNDGIESTAMAIIGKNFKSIAKRFMDEFGVVDDIYEGEKTIEEVMESIENYIEKECEYDNFLFFSYEYWEMEPKNNVELLESKNLLDIPACLKLGRDHFNDFDSVMGK